MLYLIYIFVTLLSSTILAKNIITENKSTVSEEGDEFYLIFVNNTYGILPTSNPIQKRQEKNHYVQSMVDEIHQLIMGNKASYKDPIKFDKIDQEAQLKKRDGEVTYLKDYGESNYAYHISTVKDSSLIFAYLSKGVVEMVKNIPGVKSCIPNHKFKFTPSGRTDEILKETKWKSLSVRNRTDLHLSLISQGKFHENLIGQYDKTYYYPSSAGEDVDLFIFDSGFNFSHDEFEPESDDEDEDDRKENDNDHSNSERITKCAFSVIDSKIVQSPSSKRCGTTVADYNYHGEKISDIAAGFEHGVAPKANVYGIIPEGIDDYYGANIIAGLDYVKEHLLRDHKAVFNFSFRTYYPEDEVNDALDHWQALINEISARGGIIVAAAGNDNKPVRRTYTKEVCYPCAFKNVICVGGIDNHGLNDNPNRSWSDIGEHTMNSTYYRRADFSNYGEEVDIYAPAYAYASYRLTSSNYREAYVSGTSYSTPIVVGVIATIMSEHPSTNFTVQTMLDHLIKISLKDIIDDIPSGPNIFLNNGKHVVYSANNIYHGCGIEAGHQKCNKNQCCGVDGQCYNSSKSKCKSSKGCQVNYGTCRAVTTSVKSRCGLGYGRCKSGYCCSANGTCGKTEDYCGLGCQINFGKCNE